MEDAQETGKYARRIICAWCVDRGAFCQVHTEPFKNWYERVGWTPCVLRTSFCAMFRCGSREILISPFVLFGVWRALAVVGHGLRYKITAGMRN